MTERINLTIKDKVHQCMDNSLEFSL